MASYKKEKGVIWDWLTTVDHKKLGIMYLIAGTLFFLKAGLMAVFMRIQLIMPENSFLTGQTFNEFITMHGTIMLFLAATPLLFAFMNFVIPLQIGARDVAFPFVNALGFWIFLSGGLLLSTSWFFGGGPDAGWTAYVPLSLNEEQLGLDFYVLGLQVSGIGTLISAINFLVTIINMRAPGMTMMRLPLFVWTSFVTSTLILFAFTPLAAGLALLMLERIFDAQFFNPAAGGNVVIWQHIFWIFGHPEVYILVLPAFGIISEVIPAFSRKRLFGYTAMVFATMIIAFLGFMVWAHHMFTVGIGPVANSIFAIATMTIAVPTGIKIFNWLFTMWGGKITFNTAMLFASSFVPTFVLGGVTGVMLAMAPVDYLYHDTYFVVAHFHYIIVGGIVLALFAGLFYWYPKMFNHKLNEKLGIVFFILFTIGFHLTFFVQHFLGLMGMPRRVYTYLGGQGLDEFNMISTIGTFFMSAAVIVLVINIVYSAIKGERVIGINDPWDARTLEWATPTPVPEYNFAQTPQIRSLDPLFYEKVHGDGTMKPAEPVDDIHMPNGSILPVIISIGLYFLGFGLIMLEMSEPIVSPWIVVALGGLLTFGGMAMRSLKDDHGYHIPKSVVKADLKKLGGGK
ncbi:MULTISPECIES: cytochrome c oxidase subunit I [Shouchella]|uniref:Cytochrome c oxidase subunit 1 n=3 Tax=Bacillaceae TaxID=186817 RepID=A0A060M334_9BACI|nr:MULTISPECIES: cytochrome c oxidase subunit I [Bacillaceae]RQW20786.1 cytochrome c oxidase subunit I [Bacillus sp. C1-1]AIC94953.1 cytochrome c oxidase subunit 1 [Shouchella lehensis G1]KQL58124.1 quinol oxidase subunit 1 [Alkalicoccobacillus plakortidis]MBG9784200.1 quinol oxidase subunit 1 [Shouchella lehensis]TES50811.1 cytochrome c oxidase subunit I [Shouchella lehensis]